MQISQLCPSPTMPREQLQLGPYRTCSIVSRLTNFSAGHKYQESINLFCACYVVMNLSLQ